MLTENNEKYLLGIANLYSGSAVMAIRHNENLDDEYVKPYCIDVIENNDYESYSKMNLPVKEEFMQTLMNAFCFITPETMLRLSDIIVCRIEDNNRAGQTIHNRDAIKALEDENKELQKINHMLITYARTLNPKLENWK